MFSKFHLTSDLFEARISDTKQDIEAKVRCRDGSWVKSVNYPFNAMGITAVLDLAINIHTGKVAFEGFDKGKQKAITHRRKKTSQISSQN